MVGPAGHAAHAELGQFDDHEVEVGGAEPVQPGELGGVPVPEDHVQVVVGVTGRRALVDLRAAEDQPRDSGILGRPRDEGRQCVVRSAAHDDVHGDLSLRKMR